MNLGKILIVSIVFAAAVGVLHGKSKPIRDRGDVEVVHVKVDVRSSGDAALAALAAICGRDALSDKTMVTTETRSDGYLVQVFELAELPRSNPVDPTKSGRVVARVVVGGDGLVIEKLEPKGAKALVREDCVLSALTFLTATGRGPSGAFFMEIQQAQEGMQVDLTRVPLVPGAFTQIVVSPERIIVRPGA